MTVTWIGNVAYMGIPPWAYPAGAPQVWTQDEGDVDEEDGPPDPPKCEDCGGKGKIELFTGVVDCETCGGSGY